jgi:hypothetical protein
MFEKLKEFKNDFSERLKSPFITAIIITWSLYHWRIYYLMFYETNNIQLNERIENIQGYLNCMSTFLLIWKPVLMAFLGILILNIAKSIGLLIKLLYDNWASPYIQKLLYNKNIVEKQLYEKTLKAFNRVKNELSDKESSFRIVNDDYNNLNATFINYKFNSIETKYMPLNNIFNEDYYWLKKIQQIDSSELEEKEFHIKMNKMIIKEDEKIEINIIKSSLDGMFLYFEKTLKNGNISPNFLIKISSDVYEGIEGKDTKVQYIKSKKKELYNLK